MIVGLDVGYGYTKATNGLATAILPSVVGPAVTIRYTNDLICRGEGIEMERDGRRLFVGDLARLQSPTAISPLARERDLDIVLTLALAALHEIQTYEVTHLVTGLPVSWYDDRERLQAALTGVFPFSANGEAHTITIHKVSVVPQPFGSFFGTLLTERGVLADRDQLAERRVAVLDVGTHTTDYAYADALRYVETRSGSTQSAMAEVYRILQRAIEERYSAALDLHDVEAAALSGTIELYGKRIKIAQQIADAVRAVAAAVVARAEELWPDRGRSLAAVLVTGGGGAVFFDAIRAIYAHARLVEGPQLANAEGFRRYGEFKSRNGRMA